MSRTESHRIKADYTGIEIEPKIAAETVAKAEVFVQTVERVFALDELSLAAEYKNHNPSHDDKVSEPGGLSRKSRARVLTRNHSRQRRCDVRRAKTGCAYGSTESRARKASTMARIPPARFREGSNRGREPPATMEITSVSLDSDRSQRPVLEGGVLVCATGRNSGCSFVQL